MKKINARVILYFIFLIIICLHEDSFSQGVLQPEYKVTVNKTLSSTIKFEANTEWKAVDMSDVKVKAGSALDLYSVSALPTKNENSSSKHLSRFGIGPSGKLIIEGNPDYPVRLNGYTLQLSAFLYKKAGWKEEIKELCRLSRIQGYNLFRVFGVDQMSPKADLNIQPEFLDRTDYLISQMREQGIYMHLVLSAYGLYLKDPRLRHAERDELKAMMFLGDSTLRKAWEYGAETLLNHINPYTGLAWKDDPVIACVEFFNEQELGLSRIDNLPESTQAKIKEKFRNWLKEKYIKPEVLGKKWEDPEVTSFEKADFPIGLRGSGPKTNDFLLFCNELLQENVIWYDNTLQKIGYKGLSAQYNYIYGLGDLEVRYENSRVAIINKYFNHPSDQTNQGSKCKQNSSVGDAAGYWRDMNATRFSDRPLFVTEYNHAFWNKYQHEAGILFSAYSSLQGIDALVVHEGATVLSSRYISAWSVGSSPVARANEFLSACFFLRGDVKESPHHVELEISKSYLESNCQSSKAVSTEQNKIALVCGFSIAFPWAPYPKNKVIQKNPDLVIEPSVGADVRSSDWFTEVSGVDNNFSIDGFVKKMKNTGILSRSNISKPSEGIFQSDTREITLRAKENLLKVRTPLSEAITLEAGNSEPVWLLGINNTSTPALVAVCSVDSNLLYNSKRIVMIYSTEVSNTDMLLTADRVTLLDIGKLPVLMKTGELDATLKNVHGAEMSFYALGFDGSRREKLPLEFKNEILFIHLDTRILKNGPTPFFELVME